ncbi:MAG: alpha/beta hydrolase [Christensenellales bacterium]|jgi:alpha-beta hydrolase superfamily lysophospholipase
MEKTKRKIPLLRIALAGIVLILVIFCVVCTVIAYNVLSSMSDVRVEKNQPFSEPYRSMLEEIQVTSGDGVPIYAYILPREASAGNVLILHGMHGMDASSLFDYAVWIYESGYTPVCIDMRAHGKSGGERLSFGYHEVSDVGAVIEWLQKQERFSESPVILYGLSMGGSTAINTAAASQRVDGVIAVSAFSSMQDQIADYMRKDGAPETFVSVFRPFVNLALRIKFGVSPVKDSPAQAIRHIGDRPLLIVHGDGDAQTHVSQAEKLYQNSASSRGELWIVPGADHLIVTDLPEASGELYRQKIIGFLNEHFPVRD